MFGLRDCPSLDGKLLINVQLLATANYTANAHPARAGVCLGLHGNQDSTHLTLTFHDEQTGRRLYRCRAPLEETCSYHRELQTAGLDF